MSAVSRYCREDVLRILRLPIRQLTAWEKAGLIASSENYSFDELVQLRKLRDGDRFSSFFLRPMAARWIRHI